MVCAPVACLLTLGVAAATPLTRLIGLRGGGSPVQLIDATGSLNKGAAAEAAAGASSDLTLIASVGAQARGRRLLNDLFGTEFSTGASDSGAWLAVEGSLAVLATQGSATAAEVRDGADANKLASFSLTLAGAVLVHTPSTPTDAQLQASYESLFAQRAALKESAQQKLLLLHVGEGEEAAVRKACAAAWKAVSGLAAAAFDEQYELDVAPLPHRTHEATAYATALEAVGARLRSLPGSLKPSGLGGATEAAWRAACAALDATPSDAAMCERLLVERGYEEAFSSAQEGLAPWAAAVSDGKVVGDFGAQAAALLDGSLAAFEAATVDVVGASALVAARGGKLRKALANDISSLFAKQHKLLAQQQLTRYKKQLLKVVARGGKLEEWQREGLQRQCEKSFDAALASLYVPRLLGPSQQQLLDAFGKQLTSAATALQESPAMQLTTITAMRRRTAKPQKNPRGVRVGLGVVGACHSKIGGGQGNLQTFAGYTSGLNSAHVLFSNDGGLPDSSGSEPDLLRFQPKLNFDIAI